MNAWIAALAARSWRAGVVTGLGAMTADAVLAAAVFGLESVVDLGLVVRAIYVLGAVVMTVLGIRLVRRPPPVESPPGDRRTFSAALGLGLANPFQIVWWLTAGIAFAYLGGAVLFAGLFGAIAIWIVGFPALVRRGTQRSPRAARAVVFASGALLLAFAAYFVLLAVGD